MGLISNGTTIFDAGAMSLGGGMSVMKKLTANSSATLSFVHGSGGVDFSSHKEYMFICKNIHPQTNSKNLLFNMSIDAGSNYNVTKTSTYFRALTYESSGDGSSSLGYDTDGDLGQETAFQVLTQAISNDADQSANGILHLFNPNSATFVKHFIANFNRGHPSDISVNDHAAVYANTTSDVDAIQFKMTSGNIQAGTITMYGIN